MSFRHGGALYPPEESDPFDLSLYLSILLPIQRLSAPNGEQKAQPPFTDILNAFVVTSKDHKYLK
jgi:hypothetical protein